MRSLCPGAKRRGKSLSLRMENLLTNIKATTPQLLDHGIKVVVIIIAAFIIRRSAAIFIEKIITFEMLKVKNKNRGKKD